MKRPLTFFVLFAAAAAALAKEPPMWAIGARTEKDTLSACTVLTATAASVMTKVTKGSELKSKVGPVLAGAMAIHKLAEAKGADTSGAAVSRWSDKWDALPSADQSKVLTACTQLGFALFDELSPSSQAEIRDQADRALAYMVTRPMRR